MLFPGRDRFFAALTVGTRRPGRVLLIVLVLMGAAAAAIPGIGVSTSRYNLVSEKNPYQARLVRFFERFGYPDSPLMVIDGGTAEQRRTVVSRLLDDLTAVPELQGRLLGRVTPREFAEVILLQQSGLLSGLDDPNDTVPAEVIEGGLPAIGNFLNDKMRVFAVTLQMQSLLPFGPRIDAADVLAKLTGLARAGIRTFEGEDIWDEIVATNRETEATWAGIDEHGYLASEDGSYHVLAMFPALLGDEVALLRPFVERIREIRDTALAELNLPGVTADLTGIPVLAVDEATLMKKEIVVSGIITGVVVLALFMFAFRSVGQTLLAGIPLLVGVITALAATRLLYGELNLVTSGCVSLLMGLSIAFAVHTLARYNEIRRSGQDPITAIRDSIILTGPAIFTAAITTALAFLTTLTVEFTAFGELGVISAIGLMAALFGTFVVLPPLIAVAPRLRAAAAPEVPGLRHLPRLVGRAPRVLLVGTALTAIVCAVALPNLRFNARYFDFLPSETESAGALLRLENDRGLSPTFASLSADSVEIARDYTQRLRQLDVVGSVQSPADLLPPLTEERLASLKKLAALKRQPDFDKLATFKTTSMDLLPAIDGIIETIGRIGVSMELSGQSPEPAERASKEFGRLRKAIAAQLRPDKLLDLQRQLADVAKRAWTTAFEVAQRGHYKPEDLPKIMQTRFVSHDKQAVAIFVFPNGDVWDREFGKRFTQKLEEIDPEATGFMVTLHAHTQFVIEGFERAALMSAILVLIILLLDFRSLRDSLLALLPVGLGWLWMLGTMGAADLPFNMANMVSLPLIFGIGVDAGVHLMHRCRQSAAENGGVANLDELLRGTGGAVMLGSLTTMAGFASLMISDYGAMATLGLLMVMGVGFCLLACLLVLPAILVLLKRAR